MNVRIVPVVSLQSKSVAIAFAAFTVIALAIGWRAWDREHEARRALALVVAGDQIRQAIAEYHAQAIDRHHDYPQRLSDLVTAPRGAAQHPVLSEIPTDPITGTTDWGVVLDAGRVVGVYSRSDATPPALDDPLPARYRTFADRRRYDEWKFVDDSNPPAVGAIAASDGAPQAADSSWADAQRMADAAYARDGAVLVTHAEVTREQRVAECEQVRATSLQSCSIVEARKGTGAAETCRASVHTRFDACIANRPPPVAP